ncbi:sickle tail protein homolog isoform X3 [Carassius carassius]|uniref:sickle tail protein homolog isoform X3 n=1 Tax=Carassius carassius TaxID=217509 RepID=UPI002868904E|nr:sickle tail protein homolog isoform X3 [Carassius carassius]
MSKPSRLARPSSAGPGSKLPSPRRDTPASRPRMHSMGEKVIRTESEGNIPGQNPPVNGTTHSQIPQNTNMKEEDEMSQPRSKICPPKGFTATITQQQVTHPKPLKGNLKVTSSEDAEQLSRKRQVVSTNSPGNRCEAKSSRTGVLRRHTVGGARSSQEILAMQPSDMDKKREAFLEHLKQKYPHHASAIMGHQERLREQSSKQSLACPSPVPVFVDQLEHGSLVSLDALEVMSECDMPIAFTRGSRSRASLPVVRSTNQTKDRSLGVLYLQYGDDTKQIRMPNEITSVDTIRALFVSAFPHQLNMKMLESPSTAIYVKDETRNMYYELTDVRSITDHSCLKVYHKDPSHTFSHGARPINGDTRVHREMMYAGPSGHPLRQPPMGPPPPHMQSSMSPTTPHAMPSSPSRIPFGQRTSGSGVATMPRERAAHTLPATTPVCPSSPCMSAILERRDVKPDEDVAAKSMSFPARAESHYADPYMLHHHAPPPDTVDYAYHRATMRSYSNPGVPMEPTDHPSLFRQKSRKNTDSQLPMLGSKTPPHSPQRMGEVRMMDIHTVQPQSSMTLERASPIRQSFRKETPLSMDTMVKARGGMGSPATPDLQVHNPLAPSTDPQTRERMKAMEEQIASLTGLVQHALLKSHSTNSNKEHPSEKSVNSGSPVHSTSSTGGSPVLAPKVTAATLEHSPAPTPPLGPTPLHVNLHLFRKNVSELRLQLQHMRQLQLHNQECVRAQIKHAEQEISVKLAEMLRRQDDPTQKQRTLVEEERHRYLNTQERVLTQLEDLEQYVETLRTDSSPAASQRAVTLKEVEEGAVSLRKVGENLAGLKGEFPALQSRMRAVLRVEVEAVKFLKEEPHKLDSMLKRVRTLTDTLSNLRRSTTDSLLKPSDPVSSSSSQKKELAIVESPEAASVAPQSSTVRSEVMTSNPVVIHHAQTSPVATQQSQQSTAPSQIPPAAQRRESTPSPTKQLKKPSLEQTQIPNNSRSGVSANGINGKGPSPNFIEEIHSSRSKNMNRAVSIEAAEKEWEEKRQNMGHYDGHEFERMLQEAEANMLRGIPNLEAPSEPEGSPAVVLASLEEVVETNEPTAAPAKQDDNHPNSEKPTKAASEKPPKPLEKPVKSALERPLKPNLSIKSSLERQSKTQEKVVKLPTTDKANKSPPPPPPRRNYTTNTGMTTTRSGEVIYTSRKDSVMVQEGEEESNGSASQPEPKSSPVAKPKPITPPPFAASAITEEEDEGDKIMSELQVFQKCSVKEVGIKGLVEPQIRELRPGVLLPLKDKKNTENQDDKNPDTDENCNNTIRQSPGVIYYVTAQISKGTSSASEESTDASHSPPSQVSHVNASDQSQNQLQVSTNKFGTLKSSGPASSSSTLHQNQLSLSASLKTDPPSSLEEVPASPTQGKVHVVKAAQVQVSIEERVESPTAICSPVSFEDTVPILSKGIPVGTDLAKQTHIFGSSKVKERKFEEMEEIDEAYLSPDLSGEEPPPPPPDNFAFMITNTKVQALSTGEYHQLVNAKKGSVQTVTFGSKRPSASGSGIASGGDASTSGSTGAENASKKPVIIIFDEPMDIRSAYKRLSTIFECEEELERMLAAERIDEESEETEEEEWTRCVHVKQKGDGRDLGKGTGSNSPADITDSRVINSSSSSSLSEGEALVDVTGGAKQDGKKKFKLKFPKKQLAALTQAIRAGSKTGKKTLQVVVYEDEEETDGTVRQHKETKRFEIACSKTESSKSNLQEPTGQTDEIRKNTYKTLNSLEQTIKQLENTISEMGPKSSEEPEILVKPETQDNTTEETPVHSEKGLAPKTLVPRSSSASKGPGLRKKTKPQLLPRPPIIPTTGVSVKPVPTQQNASMVSPTSRMPVPVSAKVRQQPGTSEKERATKPQKLQDSQRQFRQANGSAKRSGGDPKSTSPTVPASKIPAFSSSMGKGLSQSDSSNIVNYSPLSPCLPTSKSSIPPPRSSSIPSSHIPSLSNGSLKFAAPIHSTKGLSIPTQTQNGRPFSSSSSSCSHSPLSPTMLSHSAKSIHTIHTASFTSYSRPHNGSASKSAIPAVTVAKDAA